MEAEASGSEAAQAAAAGGGAATQGAAARGGAATQGAAESGEGSCSERQRGGKAVKAEAEGGGACEVYVEWKQAGRTTDRRREIARARIWTVTNRNRRKKLEREISN